MHVYLIEWIAVAYCSNKITHFLQSLKCITVSWKHSDHFGPTFLIMSVKNQYIHTISHDKYISNVLTLVNYKK